MLLTPEQLLEIRQIIEDHHDAFVVNTIGPEAVTAEVLARLREKGLVNVKVESIRDAYIYGQLLAMMQSQQIANMSYQQFKDYLRKDPVPLSAAEMHALRLAQLNAGQYCQGLGNRGSLATGDLIIEADAALRARTEGIIRDATALNIARRETVQKLKSDLGWATKDWARDWTRIAVTEKQNAMQRGVADHYRKEYGGEALVSKRVMPDACEHCKRLFVGPDGAPRIFQLKDLEANGTNVGRRAADWLPVVGTVHPHCSCMLVRVPEGWGYNEEDQLVPGGELGVHYEGEEMTRAMRLEADLQKAYRLKGRVNFKGLPIAIENPAGSVRTWDDGQGGTGEIRMLVGYGYVEGTSGADGDEIDVFVGPDPMAEMVYVIEQQNPKTGGLYDEQKCMVGFSNQAMAEEVYLAHFDRPDFKLYTTAMDLEQFKRWIQETAPAKGEMMKASESKYRLVIPLRKARVPAIVGAATSPAGNRSPSQYGTGPNYIIQDIPPRPQSGSLADVGYRPDSRELSEHFYQDFEAENPLKRDKEIYFFQEPLRIVRPIDLPTEMDEAQEEAREGHEERMRYLLTERIRNAPRPKNKPDIEEGEPEEDEGLQKAGKDRAPTLNKQGQFNVIKIGPRGGKIIGYQGGKPIYLHKLTGRQRAQLAREAEKQAKPKREPVSKKYEKPGVQTTPPPPGPAFIPDPAPPKGGMAKVARVGVPADVVPPPPKIPKLPNLTPDEREVETRFIEAFEKDPDGMAKAFKEAMADNNQVFETDAAKALMPEWKNPEFQSKYNTVLHQVANAIAKRAFLLRLDEIAKMPPDKREILITSGGCAGGKGSALKARPELAQSVAATWDAAGEQNATENTWILGECEKRGIKPTYLFVSANPYETWKGCLIRAKNMGRTVDARVFADSYAHGAKNFNAFYQQNKDKVSFVFARVEWPNPAQFVDSIPEDTLNLDADDVYQKSLAYLEAQKASLPAGVVAGATAGIRIWGGKAVAA